MKKTKVLFIAFAMFLSLSLILLGCDNATEAVYEEPEYEFYSLQELYHSGEISRQDLLTIAYYNNYGTTEKNEDKYPEDFVPTPKDPDSIEDSVIKKIDTDYTAKAREKLTENREDFFFSLRTYIGKYGDYIVFKTEEGMVGSDVADVEVYDYVDDITLIYGDPSQGIIVCKKI